MAILFLLVWSSFAPSARIFAQQSATPQIDENLLLSSPLALRWRYDSPQTLNFTPAVTSSRIYLPLASGILVSLNTLNGNLYWRTEIGGEISASPTADARGAYLASSVGQQLSDAPSPSVPAALSATGAVWALSQDNGVTLWMRTLYRPIQG
ncbi:MAG TPA: hypothetical protein VM870_10340, partial [Pyrinomonadaceae bacterium]|nr:hypothetical protein [Pyrinomonadaceae bacterium]